MKVISNRYLQHCESMTNQLNSKKVPSLLMEFISKRYLANTVIHWYKGIGFKPRLFDLLSLLESYSFNKLIYYFTTFSFIDFDNFKKLLNIFTKFYSLLFSKVEYQMFNSILITIFCFDSLTILKQRALYQILLSAQHRVSSILVINKIDLYYEYNICYVFINSSSISYPFIYLKKFPKDLFFQSKIGTIHNEKIFTVGNSQFLFLKYLDIVKNFKICKFNFTFPYSYLHTVINGFRIKHNILWDLRKTKITLQLINMNFFYIVSIIINCPLKKNLCCEHYFLGLHKLYCMCMDYYFSFLGISEQINVLSILITFNYGFKGVLN